MSLALQQCVKFVESSVSPVGQVPAGLSYTCQK